MRNGIAILSASCLFDDKKTVSIRHIIEKGHWTGNGRSNCIVLVRKTNGKLLFVHGSGTHKSYEDLLNKNLNFIHDQRRTTVADGVVIGFVDYQKPEDVKGFSDEILNYKGPIWVFK